MSRSRLLAGLLAGVSVITAALPASVAATWTASSGAGGAARSAADTMPAGNQPTATGSTSGNATVQVSWAASSGGVPIDGYAVFVYDASSGVGRAIGASCAGIVTTTSCTEAGVPDGSWRYTVVPRRMSWTGAESPRSDPALVDATPPTIAVTYPSAGGTYSNATWDAGCSSAICGTAADGESGVASVAVSVRQGSGSYWDGAAFTSATEVLLPASGSGSWSLPFDGIDFPTEGTYTATAIATDFGGGTTSGSVTFTIDRTAPSPTALALFDAGGALTPGTDEIRITFSEPLDVASVCSAWTGTADQTLGGSGVVVTITDNVVNDIVTVVAGACTLHVGSVATGRDYVLLTSTFAGSTAATESRVTWTGASRLLVVHIGSLASGLANPLPQSAATATYTPDAAITDRAGNSVVTTPFSAAAQRF